MPTKLTLIGHTNTGKTSLMRTLLRNDRFGEVKNSSATTRHVAEVAVTDQADTPLLFLYDTPGLEDATGVMDWISEHTSERADGIDRLNTFLEKVNAGDESVQMFTQEAKAITALLSADLALYVIDARVPPTARYKDELAILVFSAVPILPVFNFTAHTEHMADWQTLLSRRALHVASQFDTVAFNFDNEMMLWQKLTALASTLPPQHAKHLNALQADRADLWERLKEDGSFLIADFLVNAASLSEKIAEDADPTPTMNALQAAIRQGEYRTASDLLALYKFYHSPLEETPVAIELQKSDPFDPKQLAHYGIRSATGGGAGLLIGAGIDVATLGTSLGLGTVMGGLLGGSLANATAIKDKLSGVQSLSINDNALQVLANRLQGLHHTLRHTGHASLGNFSTKNSTVMTDDTKKALLKQLGKARHKSHYCSLLDGQNNKQSLRAELASKVAITLTETQP